MGMGMVGWADGRLSNEEYGIGNTELAGTMPAVLCGDVDTWHICYESRWRLRGVCTKPHI
jgi:hypothetical protein